MKPEVYSCLRMMESFRKSAVEVYNVKEFGMAARLQTQYQLIVSRLSEHLSGEQVKFVPNVAHRSLYSSDNSREELILELSSAAALTTSFLRSLDSSLEKELEAKQKELARKEKELETLTKIYNKSMEAISQLPEVQRSKAVAEWKEAHRNIESQSRGDRDSD